MHRLVLFSLLFLSGCAVAPLTQGGPARAVGEKNWETGLQFSGYQNDRGSLVLVPVARIRYGLSDRWTFTAATETETLSLTGQYAYHASTTCFAAAELGAVFAGGAVSYTLGHSVSGLFGSWEPFLHVQFFLANTAAGVWDTRFFSGSPALHPVFFTFTAGSRYWVTDQVGLGLQATALVSTRSIVFQSPLLPSTALFFLW
jgi:hypothetical protein